MIAFDASPLILLAKAELLERLLGSFPDPVVIAQAVQAESCEKKTSFDAQLIARLIAEKHIEVRKLRDLEKLQHRVAVGLVFSESDPKSQFLHRRPGGASERGVWPFGLC